MLPVTGLCDIGRHSGVVTSAIPDTGSSTETQFTERKFLVLFYHGSAVARNRTVFCTNA